MFRKGEPMKKTRTISLLAGLLLCLASLCIQTSAGEKSGLLPEAKERIGIISAMENEISLLLEQADIDHVDHVGDMDFHIGTLRGCDVVIVKAGIGKVRAAAGAATLLDTYNLSKVFFTGIAGGVGDETRVLDVVVATDLVQHDYGEMTNEGFKWFKGYGGADGYYPCDPGLVALACDCAVEVAGNEHVFSGTIATGDQFIASEEYVKYLQEDFHAIACEMEGAAIAVVCDAYDVPFVVIRTMSDKADGLAHETYENMGSMAADQSSRIVMKMLEKLAEEKSERIPVKVLLLPNFEIDRMSGDFPGEAQLYYEHFLEGGDVYTIQSGVKGNRLYVKDGVALYVTGMGKVNAALSTMAVLTDERFDFSDAFIISTGCAGAAAGYGVMGDVFVITAAVDYDLGHHADAREMSVEKEETWFHDAEYDEMALTKLSRDLTDRVYELVKDVPLETTEKTRAFMKAAFEGEEWADRDPKVLKGTTVSGDNYWKGRYDHANALLMAKTYGCPDPYALTEMEDAAVGLALRRMGMADRFIIIRDSVNMDVFMLGAGPERLWDPEFEIDLLSSENSVEAADIFETAMKNNFAVGSVVIEAALKGELG